MKTLVIGVAGTGKSYLVKEMRRKGLNAVDVDEGLTTFVDERGNEVEYDPAGGERWWKSHYFVLKLDKLTELLRDNESVYLFGNVGRQPGNGNGLLDVARLFDRVFHLNAPERLIRERLLARTDNPFGKNPEEVEGLVEYKALMDEEATRLKFEVVDATQPTDEIIKKIVGSGARRRA